MINANKLRGKMAEIGLTQAQLAHRIGVSTNTLSRKMNGRIKFTVDEAVSICTVLGIPGSVVDIFLPEISHIRNDNHETTGS